MVGVYEPSSYMSEKVLAKKSIITSQSINMFFLLFYKLDKLYYFSLLSVFSCFCLSFLQRSEVALACAYIIMLTVTCAVKCFLFSMCTLIFL